MEGHKISVFNSIRDLWLSFSHSMKVNSPVSEHHRFEIEIVQLILNHYLSRHTCLFSES